MVVSRSGVGPTEVVEGRERGLTSREVLDIVVHEVANEATVVAGLAHAVRRRWDRLDDPQRLELVDRVVRQADRLVVVIRNLRGLRGLELRDIDLDLVLHADPAGLLAELVVDLQPLAGDHLVDLQVVGALPPVLVDERLLQQVLANLLVNAAIAAPDGTAITVRATAGDGADHLVIEVADRGPGIPEAEREAVFGRGVSFRTGEGLGLGLHVCRELLAAMGGTIRAEESPEGGARLHCQLPAAPQPN